MLCLVRDCNNLKKTLGFCQKHYQRVKKHGTPEPRKWSQESLEIRFWLRVDKKSAEECWPWLGQKRNGYGRISLGKKEDGAEGAHRVSWMIANKQKIPVGMFVMHKCDNPECVNPSHLAIGTPKENTADMFRKGRWKQPSRENPATGERHGSKTRPDRVPRGTMHHAAKLTAEDVLAIRASGAGLTVTGRAYGVTPQSIYRIRKRLSWGHI